MKGGRDTGKAPLAQPEKQVAGQSNRPYGGSTGVRPCAAWVVVSGNRGREAAPRVPYLVWNRPNRNPRRGFPTGRGTRGVVSAPGRNPRRGFGTGEEPAAWFRHRGGTRGVVSALGEEPAARIRYRAGNPRCGFATGPEALPVGNACCAVEWARPTFHRCHSRILDFMKKSFAGWSRWATSIQPQFNSGLFRSF